MARAVPVAGQLVCVGGMALVVVATIGGPPLFRGSVIPGVGVTFLVRSVVFEVQAVSSRTSRQ